MLRTLQVVGIGRMARRLGFAAAAGTCGLALMAFDLPVPIPSVTPTVPAPLPSIPALLGGSGGQPSQQQAGAPAATAPAASRTRLGSGTSSLAASSLPAAPALAPAEGPAETHVQAAADTPSRLHSQAGVTAGAPNKPGGPPAPLPALVLAALGAGGALVIRRLGPLPARRSSEVRLEVTPLTEAALDAVARLCDSMLPEGAAVRRRGEALAVATRKGRGDELDPALAAVSRRARRVGIDVFCVGPSSRPQVTDRLVPA